MSSVVKRSFVKQLIESNTDIELILYGQKAIKCRPVRLINNSLNYKSVYSSRYFGINAAKVDCISLSSIHKIKVL